MVIGKIKLAPNTPSWFDSINNIHLMKANGRNVRDITDKHDFAPIAEAVEAGKIIFIEAPKQKKTTKKTTKKVAKKVAVEPEVNVIDVNKNDEGGAE